MYCQLHVGYELQFYCKDEDILICSHCLLKDHKLHHVMGATEFADELLSNMLEAQHRAKANIAKEKSYIEKKTEMQTELNKREEKILQQLREHKQQTVTKLKAHYNSLSDQIKDAYKSEKQNIEAFADTHTTKKVLYKGLVNDINKLLETRCPSQIIASKPQIDQQLLQLEQGQLPNLPKNQIDVQLRLADTKPDDLAKYVGSELKINDKNSAENSAENKSWSLMLMMILIVPIIIIIIIALIFFIFNVCMCSVDNIFTILILVLLMLNCAR